LIALEADALHFPARKWLRGPRGIAVLALSRRALSAFGAPAAPDIHGCRLLRGGGAQADVMSGADDASRYQPYGQHPALVLALGAAVRVLADIGGDAVRARVQERAVALRTALHTVPGVQPADDGGSGLVCLRCNRPAEAVVKDLWLHEINAAAVGSRYAPLQIPPGECLLRFSPHVTTTDDEIERAAIALARLSDRTG
jgi:cysteine desulfurase/selenocysteine lyase